MIELRAGRLRCELAPEQGGAVSALWRDGQPMLSASGARPLVPFSNRIAHAQVVWRGTQQPLVRHAGDPPLSIQGLAWQRAWSVLDGDDTFAMLAYEHRSAASWPFAFDCSHTVRLRPTGLELTLALTNQSAQAAPAGLGWRIALPRWQGARVDVRTTARYTFDGDLLPAQRTEDPGFATGLDALPAQGCFEGWDGPLTVGGGPARLALRSGLTHLCVALEADGLVLVPASHAPNAVHLYASGASAAELGVVILQPGESLLAQAAIELEDPA